MTFTATIQDNRIALLGLPPTWNEVARRIPGGLYRNGAWTFPLSFAACLQLRAEFGENLAVGEDLAAWAAEYKARRSVITDVQSGNVSGPGLDPRLSPQQASAATWLAYTGRAMLVTEMRSGKCPMTIEALEAVGPSAFPALIVAPNTVTWVWKDEFAKWAPGLKVQVLHGTAAQRRKQLAEPADVYVVNWEALRSMSRLSGYGSVSLTDKEKERGPLNEVGFKTVVLDEAHKAVNPKAKQTMAATFLAHEAQRRILLTGTPVVNNGGDLFSLWHIIAPEEAPVRSKWIERYCVAGEGRYGFEIFGYRPEHQAEMFEVLDPRLLRRTLREMRPGMPDRLPDEIRRVHLEGKQAKTYADLKKDMLAVLQTENGSDGVLVVTDPLVLAGRLAYAAAATPVLGDDGSVVSLACPSIKVDVLQEVLEEYPGEPLVVFCVSRKLAELVERVLAKAKVSSVSIHGGVDPQLRAANISTFQSGGAQVCIVTAGAGAEGITLNRARRTLFLQMPWSNAQFSQAKARTDGLVDGDPLECLISIVAGTIEEHTLTATDTKEGYLQEILRDALR